VIEHIARIRVQLPGGSTVPRHRAWPDAVRPLSHGATCPDEPPTRQINPQCVAQRVDAHRSRRRINGVRGAARRTKTRGVVQDCG
jgi:hypothetical protein